MISSAGTEKYRTSPATGPPLTFMYVRGLATVTGRPASRPCATSEFERLCAENRPPPARAARRSTTRKPTLCRVSA